MCLFSNVGYFFLQTPFGVNSYCDVFPHWMSSCCVCSNQRLFLLLATVTKRYVSALGGNRLIRV